MDTVDAMPRKSSSPEAYRWAPQLQGIENFNSAQKAEIFNNIADDMAEVFAFIGNNQDAGIITEGNKKKIMKAINIITQTSEYQVESLENEIEWVKDEYRELARMAGEMGDQYYQSQRALKKENKELREELFCTRQESSLCQFSMEASGSGTERIKSGGT